MDLFYSGLTPTQQLRKLTKEVKTQLGIASNTKGNSFKLILKGNTTEFGNCCLFLLPYVTKKGFMGSNGEKELISLINEYKVVNSVVSYCYHAKADTVSKRMIKECTNSIETLVSILNPKMIVLLGGESSYSFLSRKPKVEDHHGTVVGSYNNIPLLLSYHPEYFTEYSAFEDKRYKDSIQNTDWTFITKCYNKRIT